MKYIVFAALTYSANVFAGASVTVINPDQTQNTYDFISNDREIRLGTVKEVSCNLSKTPKNNIYTFVCFVREGAAAISVICGGNDQVDHSEMSIAWNKLTFGILLKCSSYKKGPQTFTGPKLSI